LLREKEENKSNSKLTDILTLEGEVMTKIEELNPNYKTALACLRYALMCLDKEDVSHARHAVRDALFRMGFKDSDVYPL